MTETSSNWIPLREAMVREVALEQVTYSDRLRDDGSRFIEYSVHRDEASAWEDMAIKLQPGTPRLRASRNDPTVEAEVIRGSALRFLKLCSATGCLLGPGDVKFYNPEVECSSENAAVNTKVNSADALGLIVLELQTAWLQAYGDLEDDVNDSDRDVDDDALQRKIVRKQVCEEIFGILQRRVKEISQGGELPIVKYTGRRPKAEYQVAIALVLKDLIPQGRLPVGPGDWANKIRKKLMNLREIDISNDGDVPDLKDVVGHLETSWKPLLG